MRHWRRESKGVYLETYLLLLLWRKSYLGWMTTDDILINLSIFHFYVSFFVGFFFFWGKHFGSSWAIGWRGIGRYTETVVQERQEIKWQLFVSSSSICSFSNFNFNFTCPVMVVGIATIGNKDGLNYQNALLRLEYIFFFLLNCTNHAIAWMY